MKQFYRKGKTIREFYDPENKPGEFKDHDYKSLNQARRASREFQDAECGSHDGQCLRTVQKLPRSAR